MNRIDALEHDLRVALEQTGTSMAAYLADHEDRLLHRADVAPKAVRG